MHRVGEKNTLEKEAVNCIENLLIREEIDVDEYEVLIKVIGLLSCNTIDLGEGISLRLVDCKAS